MTTTITDPSSNPSILRQQKYVAQETAKGDESIVVAEAFLNGIRDLGYRSTATALDEEVDNSEQAGASQVHIVFGFDNTYSEKKPATIAIIDDGHGMIPDMLGYAARWGGTDRENDRKGFGRYGYGLPSSAVSQGKRFRIFSRVQGGHLYSVTVDLAEIQEGLRTGAARVLAPKPIPATLPDWLADYVNEHLGTFAHGTIVLLEKLDRLSWVTRDSLKRHLLEHMGLIYRNYLRNMSIVIDGTKVEPIDPLFLTPGCRYYDLDGDRAIGFDDILIPVKSDDGKTTSGQIQIRISYLPPTFGYIDKTLVSSRPNPRTGVMEEHEGLIILRNGRQIDVINRAGWKKGLTFRNTDRYWQIEVDFPPSLDEEFSVTTSKQGVKLSERMWELLRMAHVDRIIADLQKRHNEDRARLLAANEGDREAKRLSEQAMENAAKFTGTKPPPAQIERLEKSQEVVLLEARRKAQEVGVPLNEVQKALELEIVRRPYALIEISEPGGPFYRPELFGGQRRVYLNTSHPFYTELYAGPDSTREVRAALEVLLFVLSDGELEAMHDRLEFYERERGWWSQQLRTALRELIKLTPEHNRDRSAAATPAGDEESEVA